MNLPIHLTAKRENRIAAADRSDPIRDLEIGDHQGEKDIRLAGS